MSNAPDDLPSLGSLAQSARGKHLKQARGIMITIGIITILFNAPVFFLAPQMVQNEIQKEVRKAGPAVRFDPNQLQQIETTQIRTTQILVGASVFLGVVFIVLGVLVKQFPVPATTLGLVLYVGSYVIFGLLYPETLLVGGFGLIIKIVIVVALVKALQAAIAFRKEQQAALAGPEY